MDGARSAPDSPHEEGSIAPTIREAFNRWCMVTPFADGADPFVFEAGYLSRNAEVERLREALQAMLDDWHSHGGSAITNARRALEGSEPNV